MMHLAIITLNIMAIILLAISLFTSIFNSAKIHKSHIHFDWNWIVYSIVMIVFCSFLLAYNIVRL